VSNVVAIYAGAVGTGSLGWQIYRERRRLRIDVGVEFEHSAEPVRAPMVSWGEDPKRDPIESQLTLIVVNRGETIEWVRSVWIEDAAETAGYDFEDRMGGDKELKPRARVLARVAIDDLPFDPSGGFYGNVRLASGQLVRSQLQHLDEVILEHVADWNRTTET